MASETVMVKVEPPDDFIPDEKIESAFMENGETETNKISSASTSNLTRDSRNFTCLLCDVICENRDELRRHLKTYHATKHAAFSSYVTSRISPEAAIVGLSTYMNYRYTCSLCGAKFKTFRSYLSHNMSHRSIGGLRAQFDDTSMKTILNTGKQYLQDYIDADDGYPGNFTCQECNTTFTQRDAYAMHMMMRAMNESCQHVAQMSPQKADMTDSEESVSGKSSENEVTASIEPSSKQEYTAHVQQKCLEDVTSKIDQDEYLKSVLDKVFVTDDNKQDSYEINMKNMNEQRKVCKFCRDTFVDQDALAMHVMSDHSVEMSEPKNKNNQRGQGLKYSPVLSHSQSVAMNYTCKYCGDTFLSRDSLAMHVLTHAHQDGKISEFLQSNNSLKRARQFEIDPLVTVAQRAKILKRVGNTYHLSLKEKILRGDYGPVPFREMESDSLFCDKCNITFYLRSEYDWHVRNYHETNDRDDPQPLCLTKHSDKTSTEPEKDVTSHVDQNELSVDNHSVPRHAKQRRNSFSYAKRNRNRDVTPRRPLSADDSSSWMAESIRSKSAERKTPVSTTSKSDKSVSISSVVPNLNALSSNEQRIIFSVFGKNLDLNKVKDDKPEVKDIEPTKDISSPQVGETTAAIDEGNDGESVSKSETESGLTVDATSDTASGNISRTRVSSNDEANRHRVLNLELDSPMCKYCEIVFFNRAIYYLHMGLHNVNNPWQCNICGKTCKDAVDFAAHVIHM